MPLLIIIGLTPRVLLKMAPANAPAAMLFAASSIHRQSPLVIYLTCVALTFSSGIANVTVDAIVNHRNNTS
jgi:hypothetical protein